MRAAKVDGNQAAFVRVLRQVPGVSVAHTHMVGDGFPDIVVGYRRLNLLVEIKDPAQPPSKRGLTPAEATFQDTWTGQYLVTTTPDDVLTVLGIVGVRSHLE